MYEKVATISCILSSIMWRALPGVYGMHSLYIQQQRGYKTETHVKGTTATSNTFAHVQRRTANFQIHAESTWIRCMNMVTKARNRCLPLLRTSKPKSRDDLVEPTYDTEPLKRVWSCIGSLKKFGNTSSVLDYPGRNHFMFETLRRLCVNVTAPTQKPSVSIRCQRLQTPRRTLLRLRCPSSVNKFTAFVERRLRKRNNGSSLKIQLNPRC